MLKKRREPKLPKWPKSKFEIDFEKFVRRLKKEANKGVRWLFFYQPDSEMDGILHIIAVLAYLYIGWFAFLRG